MSTVLCTNSSLKHPFNLVMPTYPDHQIMFTSIKVYTYQCCQTVGDSGLKTE